MYVIRREAGNGFLYAEVDEYGLTAWRESPSKATKFQSAVDAQYACVDHLKSFLNSIRIVLL